MASNRFNNNRLGGFTTNRFSGSTTNRFSGFTTNRFSGFTTNRFTNNRTTGFNVNRSKTFVGNRNITDARQVLQRNKFGQRLGGGITDLSQKLRSRTGYVSRFGQQRGGVVKQLYSSRMNNNPKFNRGLQSNSALRNRAAFRSKYVVPNLARNTILDRSKFIKVHRGGITVTAKQNMLQKRERIAAQDELEEMTLSDLPEPQTGSYSRNSSQLLEERLNQMVPRENSDPSATVLISNLKHTVTEEDINELFSVVGQMTSAQLLHPGAALVTFARKEDAVTALEYYNNVTLDGMAMRCTILSLDKQKTKPSITSRLGDRISSPLSASFLAPSRSSTTFVPISGGGRQVQTTAPIMSHLNAKRNPKFTVCLN